VVLNPCNAAYKGERRTFLKMLIGNPEGKKPRGISRSRWELR
jgi:hypothetical protein